MPHGKAPSLTVAYCTSPRWLGGGCKAVRHSFSLAVWRSQLSKAAVISSLLLVLASPFDAAADTPAKLLRVGPERAVKTIATAAQLAVNGGIIEVDAGDYVGDVAVWTRDDLTLRAVGGRVRLIAGGTAAEGKAIWVVRAKNMSVEGFDFRGARVPSRNGAGIRLDRGSLRVRDCTFIDNEMGLLTNNDPDTVLEIENSEFAHNGRPDGHNHQLYAGAIARLSVTGSYFHHGATGHLLKSRAAVNHILYNRLSDEAGGSASYELEFPNGGQVYVIGNLIQQGPQTGNRHVIAFGAEGYKRSVNELYLVHNTLIDGLATGGVFVRRAAGATVRAVNNLLVGAGRLAATGGDYRNNVHLDAADFAQATLEDYRWGPDAPVAGGVVDPGHAHDLSLQPTHEYVHPRSTRVLAGPPRRPGAFQAPTALTR